MEPFFWKKRRLRQRTHKFRASRNLGPLNWNKGCFWKFGPRIFRLYRSASFFEAHNFRKNCLPTNKDLFSGNLEILEIWKIWIQKIQKLKILKFKIHSAQHVGKVWISKEKNILAPFGAISTKFCRWTETVHESLPILLGGANGPYSSSLGSCAGVQ